MEPCGTPQVIGRVFEEVFELFIEIDWLLSDKYDLSHLSTTPLIP